MLSYSRSSRLKKAFKTTPSYYVSLGPAGEKVPSRIVIGHGFMKSRIVVLLFAARGK
jgi:hypothetical protein